MKKSRLAFVYSLAGLLLVAVIFVLAMKVWTNAPAKTPPRSQPEAPPTSEEAPAGPASADAAGISPSQEEVPTDTEAILEADSLVAEVSEMSDRERYEKWYADLRAARKELFDQLYRIERVTEDGRIRGPITVRVRPEEAIELIKALIDRFSSFPWAVPEILIQDQMTLAAWEYRAGRTDDARQTLETATSKLSDGVHRDQAIVRWASMEKDSGDVAYAERLLTDLASSAIPQQHMEEWVYEEMQKERCLEAPLALAQIYRETGRIDDAREQLDEVKRFALSLDEGRQAYGNLAWFYGRACQEEIGIIFDLADASSVETALEKAEAIATEYETTLADYRSRGSEHTRNYVDNYAKSLRKNAQDRADKIREAAGAE